LKTYLPEIDAKSLRSAVLSNDWSDIEALLSHQNYERLGLERALAIAMDLYQCHAKLEGLTVLDVGCNNGVIGKVLYALGCLVVGIDNSDVDSQSLYKPLKPSKEFELEFYKKDLKDFLSEDQRMWDAVLLLSVTHHWETGYAMSGNRRYTDKDITDICAKLCSKTNHTIYYEGPSNEPGFPEGYGISFLRKYFLQLRGVRFLQDTVGPNGYLRELWALDTR
jgi:hypothetical protein